MLYHGFYVKFTSLENIQREKKDGSIDLCGGFQIEIFLTVRRKFQWMHSQQQWGLKF